MTQAPSSTVPASQFRPFVQVRVWHLALLVAFVAIAIVDIQDQSGNSPAMIALASAGFVLYAVLGWVGWHLSRRFEPSLGKTRLLILYMGAMAALFFVATVVYTTIQVVYLTGRL